MVFSALHCARGALKDANGQIHEQSVNMLAGGQGMRMPEDCKRLRNDFKKYMTRLSAGQTHSSLEPFRGLAGQEAMVSAVLGRQFGRPGGAVTFFSPPSSLFRAAVFLSSSWSHHKEHGANASEFCVEPPSPRGGGGRGQRCSIRRGRRLWLKLADGRCSRKTDLYSFFDFTDTLRRYALPPLPPQ